MAQALFAMAWLSTVVFALSLGITDTQSGRVRHGWPRPATGWIVADSGIVWVSGSGFLSSPGDNTYNHWVTTWANREYRGTYDDPRTKWSIDAAYNSALNAQAIYVATTPAWLENYRAETTCTAEMRGDFTAFNELQVVVDSYTAPGVTNYDATGGGSPPGMYPNGGTCSVVRGPGPWSGTVANPGAFSSSIRQDFVNSILVFNAYARGKQYYYNHEEEDVSLYTSITHSDPSRAGWVGTLKVYDSSGVMIASFTLP